MGVYNSDGSIAITVVDGTTWTGLYAADGSINVVLNDYGHTGIYHPCGALRVNSDEGSNAIDFTGGGYYINTIFGGLQSSHYSYTNYNPVTALGTDLIEYWDANRADTILAETDATYTNAVKSWLGIVTGANLAQTTPLLKPTYSPTGLAGTPCIQFDGIQQYLKCTDAGLMAVLPSGATPCEIWVLCSQDVAGTDATTRHVVGYANTSAANGRSLARIGVSNVNRARTYTGTGASASVATDTHVDLSGVHVIRGIFGSTQTSVSVDGEASASVTVTPATDTPAFLMVGSIPALAASNWWQGKVSAVFLTKPLSAAKATALHAYLG